MVNTNNEIPLRRLEDDGGKVFMAERDSYDIWFYINHM